MTTLVHRFIALENVLHRLLVRHSIAVLRISVGLVFLGFGFLKLFPGVSPAEGLVADATDVLFLGLIPSGAAIYIVATMECFIGICFLIGSGSLMRIAIWVLAAQFVGIVSPLAIEPSRLFSGPHNAPTLEGQYVLKDIILVAAGMVIAAGTFRGGRMVRDEPEVHPVGAPVQPGGRVPATSGGPEGLADGSRNAASARCRLRAGSPPTRRVLRAGGDSRLFLEGS